MLQLGHLRYRLQRQSPLSEMGLGDGTDSAREETLRTVIGLALQ